jgi:hypothetical protein
MNNYCYVSTQSFCQIRHLLVSSLIYPFFHARFRIQNLLFLDSDLDLNVTSLVQHFERPSTVLMQRYSLAQNHSLILGDLVFSYSEDIAANLQRISFVHSHSRTRHYGLPRSDLVFQVK